MDLSEIRNRVHAWMVSFLERTISQCINTSALTAESNILSIHTGTYNNEEGIVQ
jgi:hypothetical protein